MLRTASFATLCDSAICTGALVSASAAALPVASESQAGDRCDVSAPPRPNRLGYSRTRRCVGVLVEQHWRQGSCRLRSGCHGVEPKCVHECVCACVSHAFACGVRACVRACVWRAYGLRVAGMRVAGGRACVRACERACVSHACVRACRMRACARVACVRASVYSYALLSACTRSCMRTPAARTRKCMHSLRGCMLHLVYAILHAISPATRWIALC